MSQPVVTVPTASLHNKVALITGASRGIGRGIALSLAHRGCSIIINYSSSTDAATSLANSIHALPTGARAHTIEADITQVPEIDRLFREALSHFGRLDIVVSNSGKESWDKTAEVTPEKFDEVFGLNTKAQFFVAQAALKYCGPNSRLILMSSIAAGLLGIRDHALYNASKSAILGMTKSFATDFPRAVKGMTVNAIAPGGVKSDMFAANAWRYIPGGFEGMGEEAVERGMSAACPLGRCAVPEDVGRVVAFLCSEDGGWVNGEVVRISGGAGQ